MPEDVGYGIRLEVSTVRKEGGKDAFQITFYPKGAKDEYIEPVPVIFDDLDEGAVSKMKKFLGKKRMIVRKKIKPESAPSG